MTAIEFQKYVGAGNDFVVIDNRGDVVPGGNDRAPFVRRACDRRFGVGADGVLLLEVSPEAGLDFRMRYYNADGSEGETCGNGSRCLALFALQNGVAGATMTFRTSAGDYAARIDGETVSMSMPDATGWRTGIEIFDEAFEGEAHFLNSGVPHAVIFVDDVNSVDVESVGAFLRHHETFAPAGANVNFVQIRNPHEVLVRTYERGVEGETLACGTGSVASAIAGTLLGEMASPVRVVTRSGMPLDISFEAQIGRGASSVVMAGPAQRVFSGRLEV